MTDPEAVSVKSFSKKAEEWLKRYFPLSVKGWGIYVAAMGCSCALCILMQKAVATDVYVPLVFVLMTLIIALCTDGYFYGFLAAVSSVFAVNWAFTYPYMKLDFSIYGYPLTFMTMLAVGFAVSTLTTLLKEQEKIKTESEKEKMRANLLRAVSHDLRTPLTSISGSIEAVLNNGKTFSEEQRRELLLGAKDDAEWLCGMVENLLSITRIGGNEENGINKKPELFEEVISETVVNFRKRCGDSVKISVSVPEEPFFVGMDAMLIEQVLLNILDNALIHGEVTKNIDIVVSKCDNFALVSVSDDGKGIDGRVLEHIFDVQSGLRELSCTDTNRCMGIGLSVCKTIIKAHGGEITAGNKTPSGAVFTFTLPV